MGTPLDTSTGVNSVPQQPSDSRRGRGSRGEWFARLRRARIALAMLILIGITTPHATSAPADEAQLDAGPPMLSAPALDDPPVIVLIGAAMLALAGALRRSENQKIRG